MNQAKLAEARRLYHHVCHGGTLTPEDVSFMVVALEEAYGEVERLKATHRNLAEEVAEGFDHLEKEGVDRLRAKKKQIYEDLKEKNT